MKKKLSTNLPQNGDAWNAWRSRGITGSEAPIIMNTSPWTTPDELFLRRTGKLAPQEQTFPMRRGLKLEPEARKRYEDMTGIEVPARCIESEAWEVARASFDGLNQEAGVAIEIKCPGREDHVAALQGKIPDKYVYQLVHQMFVAELSSLDYVSYNPAFEVQHQVARVVLYRDAKLEGKLLTEERNFWERLQDAAKPKQQNIVSAIKATKWDFPVRKR